jgi:hypothetical protein
MAKRQPPKDFTPMQDTMFDNPKIGDIFRLSTYTHCDADPIGRVRVSMRSPKGKVLVVCVLGAEDTYATAPIDIDAVMDKMGWQRKTTASKRKI